MAQSGGAGAGKGGAGMNPVAAGANPYSQAAGAQSAAFGQLGGAAGLNAAMPQATMAAAGQYMNPYTQQVLDRTQENIARQTGIQQTQNAGNAAQAGAFGGARHGLVEAQTNEAAQRQMADTAAQLNTQGFQNAVGFGQQQVQNQIGNAQQLAQGAAGLGSQSFGYGQQINADLAQQGAMTRDINEQLMGHAAGMFDRYTGQPTDILNLRLGALGANPLNNAGTQTSKSRYNPGVMDWMGMGMQMGGMGLRAGGK